VAALHLVYGVFFLLMVFGLRLHCLSASSVLLVLVAVVWILPVDVRPFLRERSVLAAVCGLKRADS
jgi:hypothetical protein